MLAGYLFQTACELRARNIGYTEGQLKNLPIVSVGMMSQERYRMRVLFEYIRHLTKKKMKMTNDE